MHVNCTSCSTRYRVDESKGGRMGRCSQCDVRFILPIPDPIRLLAWAEVAPWYRLARFVRKSGAKGHKRTTIDKFVGIVERRRWSEQERERYETAVANNRIVLTQDEERWARSERQIERNRNLADLRAMSPMEFEELVARVFSQQDQYDAQAVGQSGDNGIDVRIHTKDGSLWAVAQCKRYGAGKRVSAGEVRDFGGAFMLTDAKKGFFFTTGAFTRHAKRTAQGYPWLRTYSGPQIVDYIDMVNAQIDAIAFSDGLESVRNKGN